MTPRPYLSSFRDRHGTTRWRFRRGSRSVYLPGQPGEHAFEAAYCAALEGRAPTRAEVRRHPAATVARSLKAAWRIVTTQTAEWRALKASSRAQQTAVAERFLTSTGPNSTLPYGDMLVAELQRRHVKAILASMADTPHAAEHVLRLLRRLIGVALDEEWTETDPTHRLRYRPQLEGWRAWTTEEREQYEAHWPVGSTPRLAYALALCTGQRRSDVAALRWANLRDGGIVLTQIKTGRALWLPILPALAEALAAAPREGATILVTRYGQPFSTKALGMRMQGWTEAAGLPSGCTFHGLRKTLGKLLAEGGATTRQLMDILGHTNMQHAELYSREAEQRRLAAAGMRVLTKPRLVKG
ncbi:MAG: tyrosine-type recombinase/integrase [Alphaproteobacteria bacterium]|nr:tyrosine-type recombinase/integrase [Alphaproteobacteria bacterium]MCW5739624.1 tyrosine-type recombinase/integrase [Alphaproteobacteria bacterium]